MAEINQNFKNVLRTFLRLRVDSLRRRANARNLSFGISLQNTRAIRLRMRKVSIFKLAVANANFTTRMPVFELKSNFISMQNFKAGNFKPPGMHWRKDF